MNNDYKNNKDGKYLPVVQKQRVLNKFFQVATMRDPPDSYITNTFDSSKVTAGIVN